MSILSPKMMKFLLFLVILSLVGVGCTVISAGEMPGGAAEVIIAEPAEMSASMPESDGAPLMAGGGPDEAMFPTSEWMTLESGQLHWYAFNFDYDDGYKSPLEIKMFTEPADSAILTIRNAEQADLWRNEGENEHLGCCTVQELNEDADTKYAVWAGDLDSSGTYYIVVEHAKDVSGPATYRFEIGGEGVSMPAELYGTSVMSPVIPLPPPKDEVMIVAAGSGPDNALTPTESWVELGEGEIQWYAFNFDYDDSYKLPVEIKMFTEPADSAILTIRNAEQADLWRNEGENEHLGCCTVQELNEDADTKYAVWAGDLDSSGTYYIVVEHAKDVSGPAFFHFTVTGEGVSF